MKQSVKSNLVIPLNEIGQAVERDREILNNEGQIHQIKLKTKNTH